MDAQNPVLLQLAGRWHIVESSRRSENSLCGKIITRRGAHARLSLVGEQNVCPRCLKIFKDVHGPNSGMKQPF